MLCYDLFCNVLLFYVMSCRDVLCCVMLFVAMECCVCRAERGRRCVVAASSEDARFQQPDFKYAPLVVPSNDIRPAVNKQRAQLFAEDTGQEIAWAQAKDKPTNAALEANPALATKKLSWLNRHDRECGNLTGMLPLVKDLPVALTDHVDRSPDKHLLRGKPGKIHSWIPDPEDRT